MQDIVTREDIHKVVHAFYNRLLDIPVMKSFFAQGMEMDMEAHLDIIVNFWESALLGVSAYKGNVMLKHLELDKVKRLDESHFNLWVDNWKETIDAHYQGDKADEAKNKAESIKNLMIYKITASRKPGFIQ